MTFYFFLIVPVFGASTIVNSEKIWIVVINVSTIVLNGVIFATNMIRFQKRWNEFYLANIDATKNVILNKTCENCVNNLEINFKTTPMVALTKTDISVTKGECRIMQQYKLRKDDLPTCKKFEEIPDYIRNNFSNV